MARGAFNRLATAYIQLQIDMATVRTDLARAHAEIAQATQRIADVAQNNMNRVGTSFQGMFRSMIAVTGGNVISGAINTITEKVEGLGEAMISTNAKFEAYQTSLAVMLKSESKAANLLKDVEMMASRTPFTTPSLLQAIQMLKAYGFELQELFPLMQTIGDAAAASPEGMETAVHRISLAFGEIRSKGRASLHELNMLALAGIPAMQMLANHLGISVPEAFEKVHDKAIDAKTAITALTAGINERFGGMMEKQSRTWLGLTSTLQDNTIIAVRNLGAELFKIARIDFGRLIDYMSTPALMDNMKAAAPVIANYGASIIGTVKEMVQFVIANKDAAITTLKAGSAFVALAGTATAVGGTIAALNAVAGAGGLLGILTGIGPAGIAATAAIAGLGLVMAKAAKDGTTFNEALADIVANAILLGEKSGWSKFLLGNNRPDASGMVANANAKLKAQEREGQGVKAMFDRMQQIQDESDARIAAREAKSKPAEAADTPKTPEGRAQAAADKVRAELHKQYDEFKSNQQSELKRAQEAWERNDIASMKSAQTSAKVMGQFAFNFFQSMEKEASIAYDDELAKIKAEAAKRRKVGMDFFSHIVGAGVVALGGADTSKHKGEAKKAHDAAVGEATAKAGAAVLGNIGGFGGALVNSVKAAAGGLGAGAMKVFDQGKKALEEKAKEEKEARDRLKKAGFTDKEIDQMRTKAAEKRNQDKEVKGIAEKLGLEEDQVRKMLGYDNDKTNQQRRGASYTGLADASRQIQEAVSRKQDDPIKKQMAKDVGQVAKNVEKVPGILAQIEMKVGGPGMTAP